MGNTPRPLSDRVLIRQDQPTDMIGSLYIPDVVGKNYPPFGVIVAVGAGVSVDCPLPGARVLFKRRPASALVQDEREPGQDKSWVGLVMLHEEDLLGVVES